MDEAKSNGSVPGNLAAAEAARCSDTLFNPAQKREAALEPYLKQLSEFYVENAAKTRSALAPFIDRRVCMFEGLKTPITAVDVDATSTKLAAGSIDGRILVWESPSGRILLDSYEVLKDSVSHTAVTTLSFNKQGTILASANAKVIRMWRFPPHLSMQPFLTHFEASALCFGEKEGIDLESFLIAGDFDGNIYTLNYEDFDAHWTPLKKVHNARITSVNINASHSHMISADSNGLIVVWCFSSFQPTSNPHWRPIHSFTIKNFPWCCSFDSMQAKDASSQSSKDIKAYILHESGFKTFNISTFEHGKQNTLLPLWTPWFSVFGSEDNTHALLLAGNDIEYLRLKNGTKFW